MTLPLRRFRLTWQQGFVAVLLLTLVLFATARFWVYCEAESAEDN